MSKDRPDRTAPAAPSDGQRAKASQRSAGRGAVVSRATARADAQRTGRERVIFSSHWRRPLIIDLVLGTTVLVVGLVLAVDWSPVGGGGLGALGGLYAAMAVRRWRLWAALRRSRTPEGPIDG